MTSNSLFDSAIAVEQMPTGGLKVLIFGQPSTGKTTLGCDFPKPLLLIRPEEVEDGSRSVRTVAGVFVTPPLRDPDQLMDIIDGQRRTKRYKSILLDGVTPLQDLTIKKMMGFQDVPVQQTWGMVPQADWLRINIVLQEYLRNFLRLAEELQTKIILVGGERVIDVKKDSGGGDDSSKISVPRIMVALSPGSCGWLHAMCDYNVHTEKRPGMKKQIIQMSGKKEEQLVPSGRPEYVLHIDPADTTYATKFRKPKNVTLPAEMIDPTFAKLEKLING